MRSSVRGVSNRLDPAWTTATLCLPITHLLHVNEVRRSVGTASPSSKQNRWIMKIDLVDIRKLDLNLAVVFLALWQERSVTRAADRLALSQAAASAALARLRELCG